MFLLPDGEDAERVADWVELELCVGKLSISKSKVSSIVEQGTGAEPSEAFLSDVWKHLRQRMGRYVNPFFDMRGTLVEPASSNDVGRSIALEACLYFSLFGASNRHRSDPKLFERLSAEAIREYVGGESFVFGWPVLPNIQVQIGARVRQLADAVREKFATAPRSRYKDRGVDIITWKPFAEPNIATRRSCQYVLLSQCAAGHDWPDKTMELPQKAWEQYIHWAANPSLSFAVPCVINDEDWHDVAKEVDGILFDRIRLLNLLPTGVVDPGLMTALESWNAEQRDEWSA